jgi:hypothetical protein
MTQKNSKSQQSENSSKENLNASEQAPTNETSAKKGKVGRKGKKRDQPKRPPQIHTDEEIRGMLTALQLEYPGMSFKDLVKYALQLLCNKVAYQPPIKLARLKAETLRIMGGAAAQLENASEKTIRKIIKAKLDPTAQAKLTDELESEVDGYGEMRRTMMRQAAIPMAPNLPEAVGVGIVVLEHEKLECPHKSRQIHCDICIQILRAYRPLECDLPEDLRDPFDDEDQENE